MAGRNVSLLVLINDKKEILLQHRTKDAKHYPDHWAFFGGGIEDGETPEQALVRESFEELEYRVVAPKLLFTQQFLYDGVESEKHVFLEKYNEQNPLVLNEGEGMGWWKFEELDSLLINDHDREALSLIRTLIHAKEA